MNSTNRLKALAGLPITMSDFTCVIHPATLREIAIIGVNVYFRYVNLLTVSKDEVLKMIEQEISPFNFLFINSIYKEDFKTEFVEALRFFVKEDILILPEIEAICIGNFEDGRMLTEQNFTELQDILKFQNFIQSEVIKYTGEDEAAALIKQKLAKGREKVEKAKRSREESNIELTDLISSLSINSSLNMLEVWDLSYYTFNDQFKRMRILEQYNTGLQSIMAGADPKKIKLQDWIQSIQ